MSRTIIDMLTDIRKGKEKTVHREQEQIREALMLRGMISTMCNKVHHKNQYTEIKDVTMRNVIEI